MTRTPFGRMCNAVRENPERVEFVGYSARMVRLIAFCFRGLLCRDCGRSRGAEFRDHERPVDRRGSSPGSVLLMTFSAVSATFIGPIVGADAHHIPADHSCPTLPAPGCSTSACCSSSSCMYSPGASSDGSALHSSRSTRRPAAWRLVPAYAIDRDPLVVRTSARSCSSNSPVGSSSRPKRWVGDAHLSASTIDAPTPSCRGSSESCCSSVARWRSGAHGRSCKMLGAPLYARGYGSSPHERRAVAAELHQKLRSVEIIRGVTLDMPQGERHADHRPERRRQVDACST